MSQLVSLISNPNNVHEVLTIVLAALLIATMLLTIAYIWMLDRFFEELRSKEPDVWSRIGSPKVLEMLMLPFPRLRRFYAFLPILRQRAAIPDGEYQHAAPAYRVLRVGLTMTLLLFGVAGLVVAWISYHGL